jgi:hypothetical protein
MALLRIVLLWLLAAAWGGAAPPPLPPPPPPLFWMERSTGPAQPSMAESAFTCPLPYQEL